VTLVRFQQFRRSFLLLAPIADWAAYAAVVLGSGVVALCLVAFSVISTLVPQGPRSFPYRRLAALTAFFLVAAIAAFPFTRNALDASTAGVERMLPVMVALAFALRPTATVFCFGTASSRRLRLITLSVNVTLAATYVGSLQFLANQRPELPQVASATVLYILVVEATNALAFARLRGPNPTGLSWASLIAVVAVTAVVWTASAHIANGRGDGGPETAAFWWPAEGEQQGKEFSTADAGFGWANIGHWGEFPRLASAAGFRVIKPTHLSAGEVGNASLLVLPTPFRPLSADERRWTTEYLNQGGRVLVVAEHSDLEGVQGIYNPLLEPLGIHINFDTTNGLFGDTLIGVEYGRNPAGDAALASSYLTHNRGASLTFTRFDGESVLRGRWWHSDAGDPLAPERAFLSDYRLSPGDKLGDLLLAGERRVGKGLLVVWGDSSPFLNQNIIYNSSFLIALLSRLTTREGVVWWPRFVALVGLAGVIVSARSRHAPTAVFGFILLGVALVGGLDRQRLDSSGRPQNIAIVSDAENNDFPRDPFSPIGVTGLGVWLSRAGFVPMLTDWHALRQPPALLFVLNPRRFLRASYATELESLAARGTTVVVSGGGDNETFRSLAERLGAKVVGHPLGSAATDDATTYSAWEVSPVRGTPVRVGDLVIGIARIIGKGRLLVVADQGFFCSKNIEGEESRDAKNQQFLERLLLRSGGRP
jgi:hypothetical protein